jgi:hypothetical protein
METLGAVGCPPNADTYELVSQTAVQSIRFMLGVVSVRTQLVCRAQIAETRLFVAVNDARPWPFIFTF